MDLEKLRVATSDLLADLTGLSRSSVDLRALDPDAWFQHHLDAGAPLNGVWQADAYRVILSPGPASDGALVALSDQLVIAQPIETCTSTLVAMVAILAAARSWGDVVDQARDFWPDLPPHADRGWPATDLVDRMRLSAPLADLRRAAMAITARTSHPCQPLPSTNAPPPHAHLA